MEGINPVSMDGWNRRMPFTRIHQLIFENKVME